VTGNVDDIVTDR